MDIEKSWLVSEQYDSPRFVRYVDLNSHSELSRDGVESDPQKIREGFNAEEVFRMHANIEGLDKHVKILSLPLKIDWALSLAAQREMRILREKKFLSTLRGGRFTDLARPLGKEVVTEIKENCPNLEKLVSLVEEKIADTNLFVRAIKIDEARRSSTAPSDDKNQTNFHFDGGKSSVRDFPDPVFQVFVNIGALPRQFYVITTPLDEMVRQLKAQNFLNDFTAQNLPLNDILKMYQDKFDVNKEVVVVESGQMAIFDGKVFAHDAGKGLMRALKDGDFRPSNEDDFVMVLDFKERGDHETTYDPNKRIFEDFK